MKLNISKISAINDSWLRAHKFDILIIRIKEVKILMQTIAKFHFLVCSQNYFGMGLFMPFSLIQPWR